MSIRISEAATALSALDAEIRRKGTQLDELQAAIIILQEQRAQIHNEVRQLERKADLILRGGLQKW